MCQRRGLPATRSAALRPVHITAHSLIMHLKVPVITVLRLLLHHFIMAALCNRAGHYIFALWFLSSFFLSFFLLLFFLAQSQRSEIRCLPYFHTWCGLSASLGCRSEMCCTRLAENAGRTKSPKSRHLRTVVKLCRVMSSQLKHLSTIGKKLVKQQYLLQMSPQYGELRPAEVGPVVWGTPANFNGFRVSWQR